MARTDPFGLFRAFTKFQAPETVLILPKRYPLPPIILPGTTRFQQGGVALALNVGQSDEFVLLREYRRDDPIRRIHWRSWARIGKPIVREFEDEFFSRYALVLDTFSDEPYSEPFEEAVSVASHLPARFAHRNHCWICSLWDAGLLFYNRARAGACGTDAGNSGVCARLRGQTI